MNRLEIKNISKLNIISNNFTNSLLSIKQFGLLHFKPINFIFLCFAILKIYLIISFGKSVINVITDVDIEKVSSAGYGNNVEEYISKETRRDDQEDTYLILALKRLQ